MKLAIAFCALALVAGAANDAKEDGSHLKTTDDQYQVCGNPDSPQNEVIQYSFDSARFSFAKSIRGTSDRAASNGSAKEEMPGLCRSVHFSFVMGLEIGSLGPDGSTYTRGAHSYR